MPDATGYAPDLTPYFKLDGSRTITGATILNNTLNVSGLLTLGAGATVTGSISATQDITARSLATTRTLSSFTTSYGLNAAITAAAAGAATDLSALYASATHSGPALLTYIEGLQVYTTTTAPTSEHYGLYLFSFNQAATDYLYGTYTVARSDNSASVSTRLTGAYVGATLSSGSVPLLIGLDVNVANTGTATTIYGLRVTGGGGLITGNTLTGTAATSLLSLAQTWNTTGTPTALLVSITNTASNAASKLLDLQLGGVSQVKIQRNGYMAMGLGSSAPATMIDMVSANAQFIRMRSATTDATIQRGYLQVGHYTAAEEDLNVFHANVQSGVSQILIGGGVAALNAATQVALYTAANNTTTTGTARLSIDSSGDITLGAGTDLILNTGTGTMIGTNSSQLLSFWGAACITRPTVTGSKASGAALASLLTALANAGLITDSTSA